MNTVCHLYKLDKVWSIDESGVDLKTIKSFFVMKEYLLN